MNARNRGVTPLGMALRELRTKERILLADFAEKVGVTPAFVSSIEHGRKAAPTGLIERVIEVFRLRGAEADKVRALGQRSAREVRLPLDGESEIGREAALAFARRFPTMSEKKRQDLLLFLEAD